MSPSQMTMPNVMEMIAQLGPGPGPGPGSGPGPAPGPGSGHGHGPGPSPYPPHLGQHPGGNGGDYPGAGKDRQGVRSDIDLGYWSDIIHKKVKSVFMEYLPFKHSSNKQFIML